jgi:hypothetical protein
MEQLTVGAGPDLIHDSGLQVDEDSSGADLMKPFRPKFTDKTYFGHFVVCNHGPTYVALRYLNIQDYFF